MCLVVEAGQKIRAFGCFLDAKTAVSLHEIFSPAGHWGREENKDIDAVRLELRLVGGARLKQVSCKHIDPTGR